MRTVLPTYGKYADGHLSKIFSLVICLLLFQLSQAQTGYIYLHKKALDESSSVDFTFTLTDNVAFAQTITLNDKPDYFNIGDIGASHGVSGSNFGDGQLWATTVASPGIPSYAQEGAIYMRSSGSSSWLPTGLSGYRLDGAGYNTMVYINQAGNAYFYTYGGAANQIYDPANHGNSKLRDIAYGNGLTVVTTDAGHVLKYTGTYAAGDDNWIDLTLISGIPAYAFLVYSAILAENNCSANHWSRGSTGNYLYDE
jgi:hypothetical protein